MPRNHFLLALALSCCLAMPVQSADVRPAAPDLGTFAGEADMQHDLLQMLATFATYLKNDYQDLGETNAAGEPCGTFRSHNTLKANEDGVRTNADLGMVAAFLCRYARDKVTLPEGVAWSDLEQMAMRSLVYAYSTHKANRLKSCQGNRYWGSTSATDHQWESSLWAMSVAYSAFFQWDWLSGAQRTCIERMLKAECNYELERDIPTGYRGDTKAEENGWEACVLAATLGMFPNDELAPRWFERLRLFAINSYSHPDDANDTTVVDPHYDRATVRDLYRGANLYPDYTLQNHDFFHTSYQNVVIQELGEAALALELFQRQLHGTQRWHTRALMHNNLAVQREVLNWLALADGELAMPNGNDWSLFLYDQLTSYTTNAVFLRDADALMLENRAYKMIKARQATTADGSWLLRSDIGARRMGVQAHRVMMTWLMHALRSTASMQPTTFGDFRRRHAAAKVFESQNIVRGYTPQRFTTFGWAPGIKSYTGYIAVDSPSENNIIVPFKANNTGNLLGWYTVEGRRTNAVPVVSGNYLLDGAGWAMNGALLTNDSTLDHRFAIYSTPGNAVVYLDRVTARADVTLTREQGGLTAISTDPFTRETRTLYHETADGSGTTSERLDGTSLTTLATPWVNIDNVLGVVGTSGKAMAFGDRADNNSVMTSKLYAAYADGSRSVTKGQTVDARHLIYYSNVTADSTRLLSQQLIPLLPHLPEGWNGVIAADPDGTRYLLLSRFGGEGRATLTDIATPQGAPVFGTTTTVGRRGSRATFAVEENHSVAQPLRFFVTGSGVTASAQDDRLRLTASRRRTVTVASPGCTPLRVTVGPNTAVTVTRHNDSLNVESER